MEVCGVEQVTMAQLGHGYTGVSWKTPLHTVTQLSTLLPVLWLDLNNTSKRDKEEMPDFLNMKENYIAALVEET